MKQEKGQIGIEYLIVVGFVTFAIISIVTIAYYYSNTAKDSMRLNQIESFANKLTSAAESVYYAGQPSKATINAYLPDGVISVEIFENNVVISTRVSTGIVKRAFKSNVPIIGSVSSSPGIKKLKIEAGLSNVNIAQV